jgi:hypothetical protein
MGSGATPRPVGATLANVAPAWEDRFDDTADAFEEGQTAEAIDSSEVDPPVAREELTAAQRSRLRSWVHNLSQLTTQLPPLERIAAAQLVIAATSALIWDEDAGSRGWFSALDVSLQSLTRNDWPAPAIDQAAAIAAIGTYRLRMATAADERGAEALRFKQVSEALKPLIARATPDVVAANLSLLDGATLSPRSAQEVLQELDAALESRPDAVLLRVLEQILPSFEAAWLDGTHLHLSGRTSNPLAIAATVLKYADDLPRFAVTIQSASAGRQSTVVRIPGRITVLQVFKDRPTYVTYDTMGLLNAPGILTNPEMATQRRLSSPPLTHPDLVDLEVLRSVGLHGHAPSMPSES